MWGKGRKFDRWDGMGWRGGVDGWMGEQGFVGERVKKDVWGGNSGSRRWFGGFKSVITSYSSNLMPTPSPPNLSQPLLKRLHRNQIAATLPLPHTTKTRCWSFHHPGYLTHR